MSSPVKSGLGIEEVIGDKRAEILRLAHQHGAFNVRIFGSVARGEARSDSDVDFLVEWDYTRLSPWGGVGFEIDLQALLGRTVDVVSEKWVNPRLREQILREAVPL
jgi:hypothetical protein